MMLYAAGSVRDLSVDADELCGLAWCDRLLWFCDAVREQAVAVDLFTEKGLYLWEDGAKFMGIVTWLAYFARVSAQVLRRPRPVAAKPLKAR